MLNSRNSKIAFVILGVLSAGVLYWHYSDYYEFAYKNWLWLFLAIPLYGVFELLRKSSHPELRISSLSLFDRSRGSSLLSVLKPSYFLLQSVALALLILAVARPQSQSKWQDVSTEGIDIVVSLDVSASMLARDFEPDRLEAARKLTIDFVDKRPTDRIGLVIYEGEAFTQCPLTTDHRVLKNLVREVKTGLIEGGTAIGMGLATAVNRLRESEAKSRVIILLTDGVSNRGSIPPLTAAEIAREFGIRVHTIGVGSKGKALSPVAIYPNGKYKYDYVDVEIDEDLMKQVAEMTGGEYFRATDNRALQEIFTRIDEMEKTKIEVTQHSRKHEEYLGFALAGLALLAFDFILRTLIFKVVP